MISPKTNVVGGQLGGQFTNGTEESIGAKISVHGGTAGSFKTKSLSSGRKQGQTNHQGHHITGSHGQLPVAMQATSSHP